MITPHRFAALPSTLILLLLTCLPTPALGDDSEDGPSTLTLTTAEHYVEELESETEWARGKPFKLGHSAREARDSPVSLRFDPCPAE